MKLCCIFSCLFFQQYDPQETPTVSDSRNTISEFINGCCWFQFKAKIMNFLRAVASAVARQLQKSWCLVVVVVM